MVEKNMRMKTEKREKCKCGGFRYSYEKKSKGNKSILKVHVCYKCGRFKGESMSDEVLQLLCNEPDLLAHMIHSGYLEKI